VSPSFTLQVVRDTMLPSSTVSQNAPSAHTAVAAEQSPPMATGNVPAGRGSQIPVQQVASGSVQAARLQYSDAHSSLLKQAPPSATVPWNASEQA
jgi:hypothetical protein